MKDSILVHGAFEPGIPTTEQKRSVLLETRNGEAYLKTNYDKPWYELYDQEKPIIAGHCDYPKKLAAIQIFNQLIHCVFF